jgi:hypothetical protein
MSSDRSAQTAAVMSTGAAIAGVLGLIQSRKPGGEVVIPDEVIQLLMAMAATTDSINAALGDIIEVLAGLQLNVKGWPPNLNRFATISVNCAVANQPFQPEHLYAPDGMALLIRSHPGNAPGSLVRVATSPNEAITPDASYPLQPSETVAYYITDAHEVFVSSTAAGSIVLFSIEQE